MSVKSFIHVCNARLCHAKPYVPQVRWIICSFSSLFIPRSHSLCTYFFNIKTSVHFILFRSGGGFHFLFIFFSASFGYVENRVFFSSIIFIHITCLRMYSNMKKRKKIKKAVKLLENLLCESEWVCAFSIKFNKHTNWVELKKAPIISSKRMREKKKRKQFNKIHLFPYCQISLFAFMLLNCFVAVVSRSSSRNNKKKQQI